jgi:hypothetical protein
MADEPYVFLLWRISRKTSGWNTLIRVNPLFRELLVPQMGTAYQ